MTQPSRPRDIFDEDTSPPGDPVLLAPQESAILGLLRAGVSRERIHAIGAWRRAWTPADVDRIVRMYTTGSAGTPDRVLWRPRGFTGRYGFAGAPPRDVEITVRQAEVLDGLCRGLDRIAIADGLGISPCTVAQVIRAVVNDLDADDVDDAVRAAQAGEVRLYIAERRSRAARAPASPSATAA